MATLNPNIPIQNEQLRRLFRVKRVEGEMLLKRGFSLQEVYVHTFNMQRKEPEFLQKVDLTFLQDPLFTFEQFLEWRKTTGFFGNRQDFSSIYHKFADDGTRIDGVMVLYLNNEPGKKVKKDQFNIVTTYIQTKTYHHFILVTETGLGTNSASFVKDRVGYIIEVFRDFELAFNRTKHAMAPITVRHIPSAALKEVAAEEGLQPEKLPLIFNTDPLSKWYGAKPLDMFITEIMGTTTDTAGYYRLVRTFNEKKPGKDSGKKRK